MTELKKNISIFEKDLTTLCIPLFWPVHITTIYWLMILGSANAILPYTFVRHNTVIFIASIGHKYNDKYDNPFLYILNYLSYFLYLHKIVLCSCQLFWLCKEFRLVTDIENWQKRKCQERPKEASLSWLEPYLTHSVCVEICRLHSTRLSFIQNTLTALYRFISWPVEN